MNRQTDRRRLASRQAGGQAGRGTGLGGAGRQRGELKAPPFTQG